MQFSSTPRGAHLARHLALDHLAAGGRPRCSDTSDTVALLVAELAANAVRHGLTPGRDFHLRLNIDPTTATTRIEVSDACGERSARLAETPSPEAESGRGLRLVDILATCWGSVARHPIGKTVWCEIDLPQECAAASPRPTSGT
ncbi:ATP-binding protein [Saccharothrix sp. ST-888]|uniref:ATP-binding protein n=1 Tax=Saccharothrix sp. ST-888 TaxID=1427391 RepID=UPI0005EC971E|nr:ATP-binding protein [Saccharothrix sp. ST-888]